MIKNHNLLQLCLINKTSNTVFQVMKEFSVYNMIFSSSATVYGSPKYLPIDEKHPVGGCTNPYGKTKYFIEEILQDICTAEKVSVNFNFKLPNVNTDYILPMNITEYCVYL